MTAPVTIDQKRVFERVTGIADPVAECRKRWPDFALSDEIANAPNYAGRMIVGRWTRDGVARQLASPIALNPTPEARADAQKHIAVAALLAAENGRP